MPYDNNNNERGFDRENRSERNFDSNREGGYNRGGYNSNREGGFNNNREGGFNREGGGGYNREGGFNRGGGGGGFNREGGGGYNREGGFNRGGGGGGFNREGGGGYNREGGFNRGGGGGFNREGGGGYNREGGFGNRGGFEGGEGGFDKQEIVHSEKVRAGNRRTYFMDIKKTRGDDFFLTITESTKNFNGYTRHKIFLYKEDVNRFVESLNKVVEHLKTELMPEYDFDEFARRYEEGAENNEEGGDGPRYRRNEGGYDSANDRSFGSSEASEDAPTSSYSKPEETAADDDDDTWKD